MKKYVLLALGFLCPLMAVFAGPSMAIEQPDTTSAGRYELIAELLNSYEQAPAVSLPAAAPSPAPVPAPAFVQAVPQAPLVSDFVRSVKMSVDLRTSFSVNSQGHATFFRANGNLNERDFRMFSHDQLNNGVNTYDPGLYSRLRLVMDATVSQAVKMHLNVTADPWSYTGKSKEQTITTSWGDTARIRYYSWGNTGYTLNRIVTTDRIGGSLILPEMKANGDKVRSLTGSTSICNQWGQCDSFSIPDTKLNMTFQPIRELWFDVKPSNEFAMRIFPMGYQEQALTTDDPLHVSNNKIYWEESPWIHDWTPGHVNTLATPENFTKGLWDRSLAFAVRDSDGIRLTALRGVAMSINPTDQLSMQGTVATPKTLWQDYNEYTAIPGSVRVKQLIGDKAYVGATANMHLGYVQGSQDAANYVESMDAAALIAEGVKLTAQASASTSRYDMLTPAYESTYRGGAYYAALETSTNPDDMLRKDYFGQQAGKERNFYKTKLFAARMDKNFESSLANYHETRDDTYWGRHLTFYPSIYKNMPGTKASMAEEDLEPFRLGNGIDYGRNVVGWRGDTSLADGWVKGMMDVRHVTTVDGKNVETVARTEWANKTTDKLTTKASLLWHSLPNTHAGSDPTLTDGNTGQPLANAAVQDGRDPSVKTASLGASYDLTEKVAVNGAWEHTNDFTVAAGDFPRGLFNDAFYSTYIENGKTYSARTPFLYNQGYFPQAPYAYHDIFKAGILFKPTDVWNVYVDYARNPNKFAGNIDDNMNHVGIESSYVPTKSLGFFARYTMAKMYDIDRLYNGEGLHYTTYNNVFLEARYLGTKDSKYSLQYGVGPAYMVSGMTTIDPRLSYYTAPVLDTEHSIRMTYEKKF
ncbi:MAG: hypothetical protein HQL19_07710 [Candidatus Omnitrophica bacterium]|nr:hypothetical protein [Candidatus Omnitrophota bacterium]